MLLDEIDSLLREAIRARDLQTANCLRMLKTKVIEKRTSADFKGEVTDDVVKEVAGAYVKMLEKALAEYVNAGDRAATLRDELKFEIGYLQRFLPKRLGEAETGELVRAAIAAVGAKEPREAGKVVGQVMKSHKAEVDATLVKRLAEQLLGGS